MGLLQPSPALPEGCLLSKAHVLKVIKSGADYISGKGPTEMLSSKVVWFFLTLLEFLKLLCGGFRLICVWRKYKFGTDFC